MHQKIIIILVSLLLTCNLSFSQFVQFEFNSVPYLEASYINKYVGATNFALSSGSISTGKTTGTYFVDEPYIEEGAGWTASIIQDAKYFYVTLTAKAGQQFTITNISFEAYVTAAGPSAIGVLVNTDSVYGMDMPASALQTINVPLTGYEDLTNISIKIAGWDNDSRESSGAGAFRLDNVAVQGSVSSIPLNDSSSIVAQTNFEIPASISSLQNTENSIKALEFIIADSATADNLPTVIDSLKFTPGGFNQIALWPDILEGASLYSNKTASFYEAVINENGLSFYFNDGLEIQSGILNADTLNLFIWLKSNVSNYDHKQLDFMLDSTLIYCNAIGSEVGFGKVQSGNNKLKIAIDASTLNTIWSSSRIFTDSVFSLGVYATDANGNTDFDYNEAVSLQLDYTQGNFEPAAMLNGTMQNGFYQFNNLKYTAADTISVALSANGLTSYTQNVLIGRKLFADNFEENDLMKWRNTNSWIVENDWLKHDLSDSSAANYISTDYLNNNFSSGLTSWQIELKNGNFDPSSANKFWYYLMSGTDSLKGELNYGYAVGVNMTGSTDSLSLWRIDEGNARSLLIQTDLNWDTNTNCNIEVNRRAGGSWQIGFDTTLLRNSSVYSESYVDNTFTDLHYHGLVYVNTKTNAGELYMNSVEAMQLNTGPEVISVTGNGMDSLLVVFSEPVDASSAILQVNYLFTDSLGSVLPIELIHFNGDFADRVTLKVEPLHTQAYLLHVSGVKDEEQESMQSQIIAFNYRVPTVAADVVISEIFADQSPVVGLPEDEFIEIYNSTAEVVFLSSLYLQVNSTKKQLPSYKLKPKQYLILCSSSALDEYTVFGDVLAIPSFPSLTNSGTNISLTDSSGNVINTVSYSNDWYGNDEKASGGWSLEKIDLTNNCGGIKNWTASVNTLGGTPGNQNSVIASNTDNSLPEIQQIVPVGKQELLLVFSEVLDTLSAKGSYNFEIVNLGNPIAVIVTGNTVVLQFNEPINEGENQLIIKNIADPCGNVIPETRLGFTFYLPKLYDVVFNEVMEDSDPSIDLPNADYIELYNRTDFGFFLYQWQLEMGSSKKTLQTTYIDAHSYLIVCAENDTALFKPYGNVAGVDGTLNLSSSAWIGLLNNELELISFSNYSSSWIIDDFKQEGGFSLERIDFNNLAENQDNWAETQNTGGGTPGKENSIYRENPDYLAGNLLRVVPMSDQQLRVEFDKSIKIDQLSNSAFMVDDSMGEPNSISYNYNDLNTLYLNYTKAFSSSIVYELTVNNTVVDLSGNMLERNYAQFMLSQGALPFDVVINEVLFNPKPDGVDFVELYNRSSLPINLKQFNIASRDEDGNIKSNKKITTYGALILPNEYLVLSSNASIVKQQYWADNVFAFYDVKELPGFSDDEGAVVLLDTLGNVIDELNYNNKMHFDLLNDTEGISLERINYNTSSTDKTNWHSSAEQVGWATPGYKNSVFNDEHESNSMFELEPEAFSPNNDGFDDQLNIHYKVNEAGWVASITILESNGRKIRRLVQNELLEIEGSFAWDGLNDDMQLVPIGIYIVLFEYYNLNGELKEFYKPCVVSTKF